MVEFISFGNLTFGGLVIGFWPLNRERKLRDSEFFFSFLNISPQSCVCSCDCSQLIFSLIFSFFLFPGTQDP